MTSHSLSEVSDIPLALQNDSSSGATLNGPYKDSNLEDIQILDTTRPKVQGQACQGESYGRATTIDTLPEDTLLEIFYSYQMDDDLWPPHIPASCRWLRLVHVCRRWRQLVFGSPLHLDLQLFCTHRTPVRSDLGLWPPFPIVVEYGHPQGLTSYDEDNLFAVLEHPDRIRHVNLSLPSSQLSKVVAKMQEPLPTLKHFTLLSNDGNTLVLPGGFLGAATPCLQRITLGCIVFPALPTLLTSSNDIVSLKLYDIPPGGYISPDAMVACLAASPRLETFLIGFQSATPRPNRIRLPLVTRTVLPSLIHIEFSGASEYLEELVSQIDGPQLNQIHMTYLNQLVDFQVAQLFRFIDRSEGPELTLLRHADVTFTDRLVSLELYQRPPHHPNRVPIRTSILCQGIDWQVSHIAQVLRQPSTILSHVIDLKLGFGADEGCQLESVDNAEWLLLLRQFSVVQTLDVPRELAGHVALALEDVTEEMAAEVLPALKSINLAGQLALSVNKFVTVRRLTGRPVTVVGVVNAGDVLLEKILDYVPKHAPSEQETRDKQSEEARSSILGHQQLVCDREVVEGKAIHARGIGDKMLGYVSKHAPSEQEKRGDKLLDDTRAFLENWQAIHPDDRKVVEERIIYAREMKTGLDTRWGLSKLLLAREYRKAAKSAFYAAKVALDWGRDNAYFVAKRPSPSLIAIPEMRDRDHVTGVALSLRRIYLSCKDAFPTPQTKEAWEVTVWHEACAKTGSNLELFMPFELFADSNMKFFVDTKTKIMHVVEAQYGFDTSHAPDSISCNKSLAQALLSGITFIYREPDSGGIPRHPYRHPGLQKAINITWFQNKEADGVTYHEHFSPLSVPAIAFILTVVECCIDEWTDGTRKDTEWDENQFKTVYQSHISSLNDFREHGINQGVDLFEHIRGDLLKEARKHAGVPPAPVTESGNFSRGALDAALQEDLPAYPD